MKQILLTFCCITLYLSAHSQVTTAYRSEPLDTNAVAYDEQGKELHYYQYIKLLNTGMQQQPMTA